MDPLHNRFKDPFKDSVKEPYSAPAALFDQLEIDGSRHGLRLLQPKMLPRSPQKEFEGGTL